MGLRLDPLVFHSQNKGNQSEAEKSAIQNVPGAKIRAQRLRNLILRSSASLFSFFRSIWFCAIRRKTQSHCLGYTKRRQQSDSFTMHKTRGESGSRLQVGQDDVFFCFDVSRLVQGLDQIDAYWPNNVFTISKCSSSSCPLKLIILLRTEDGCEQIEKVHGLQS